MTETMKTQKRKKPTPRRRGTKWKRSQQGGAVDLQKWLAKTGKEFHWPGYQYMGPGTHLAKRLKRGDPGINRFKYSLSVTVSLRVPISFTFSAVLFVSLSLFLLFARYCLLYARYLSVFHFRLTFSLTCSRWASQYRLRYSRYCSRCVSL